MLGRANYFSPSQRETVVQLAIVTVFHYCRFGIRQVWASVRTLAMWVCGYPSAWGYLGLQMTPFFGSAEGKAVGMPKLLISEAVWPAGPDKGPSPWNVSVGER